MLRAHISQTGATIKVSGWEQQADLFHYRPSSPDLFLLTPRQVQTNFPELFNDLNISPEAWKNKGDVKLGRPLPNLGNTCYANATMLCFHAVSYFRNSFIRSPASFGPVYLMTALNQPVPFPISRNAMQVFMTRSHTSNRLRATVNMICATSGCT